MTVAFMVMAASCRPGGLKIDFGFCFCPCLCFQRLEFGRQTGRAHFHSYGGIDWSKWLSLFPLLGLVLGLSWYNARLFLLVSTVDAGIVYFVPIIYVIFIHIYIYIYLCIMTRVLLCNNNTITV